VSSAAVPEATTWLMMVTGFGILGAGMWKPRSVNRSKNGMIDRVENFAARR
jgi:hypothetical protein